jgi:toxin YoeB
MKLLWTEKVGKDYLHWRPTDPDTLKKINALIKDIGRHPFRGLGKPEAFKFALSSWWSRRISREHRLVYRASGKPGAQVVEIVQCRYHY